MRIEVSMQQTLCLPQRPDFLATNRKIISRVRRLFKDFFNNQCHYTSHQLLNRLLNWFLKSVQYFFKPLQPSFNLTLQLLHTKQVLSCTYCLTTITEVLQKGSAPNQKNVRLRKVTREKSGSKRSLQKKSQAKSCTQKNLVKSLPCRLQKVLKTTQWELFFYPYCICPTSNTYQYLRIRLNVRINVM